ncbi:hypothetical protein [Methanothermococcus okinawensis]|uniref:Uncharacterized protein n=1 Tax=Methanothermococcus okinawensis (strain DSM 14208 / JCM 11175 / IH1) TaxID=647113 RepID=F8AJS2_METOI|nr:hypothetical protein [Methanothermococcus okinawensis]AEH07270.1 hypothetical protein Metok_1302 [Methanothermococcus okinawensis IH1]
MGSLKGYIKKFKEDILILLDKCITNVERTENLKRKEYLLVRMDLLGDFFVFFPFF